MTSMFSCQTGLAVIIALSYSAAFAQNAPPSSPSRGMTLGTIGDDGRDRVYSDTTGLYQVGDLLPHESFEIQNRRYSFDYVSADQVSFTPYMTVTPIQAKENLPHIIYLEGTGLNPVDSGHWLAPLIEKSEFELISVGTPGVPAFPYGQTGRPELNKADLKRRELELTELIEKISRASNSRRIFICGHSQGGFLALKAARDNPKVAGAIALATPPGSWAPISDEQLKTVYRAYFRMADANQDNFVDKIELKKLHQNFTQMREKEPREIQFLIIIREGIQPLAPTGHTLSLLEDLFKNTEKLSRSDLEAYLKNEVTGLSERWLKRKNPSPDDPLMYTLMETYRWQTSDTEKIQKPILFVQGFQDNIIRPKFYREFQSRQGSNPQRFFLTLLNSGHVPWQNDEPFNPRQIGPKNDDVEKILSAISSFIKQANENRAF